MEKIRLIFILYSSIIRLIKNFTKNKWNKRVTTLYDSQFCVHSIFEVAVIPFVGNYINK